MELSRRKFLAFVGVTGGAAAADALPATAAVGADGSAEPPKPSVIGIRRRR
jgi:hypothetical protein